MSETMKAIDKAKNYSNQATIEMKRGDIQEAYKMMVLAYAHLEQALTQDMEEVIRVLMDTESSITGCMEYPKGCKVCAMNDICKLVKVKSIYKEK